MDRLIGKISRFKFNERKLDRNTEKLLHISFVALKSKIDWIKYPTL